MHVQVKSPSPHRNGEPTIKSFDLPNERVVSLGDQCLGDTVLIQSPSDYENRAVKFVLQCAHLDADSYFPRYLESVCLSAANAESFFVDKYCCEQQDDGAADHESALPAMTWSFGRLKSLDLTGDAAFHDGHVKHLPRALMHLALRVNNLLTGKSLPHLPPYLVSLRLPYNCNISLADVVNLPRTLRLLELGRLKKIDGAKREKHDVKEMLLPEHEKVACLMALPPHLTYLCVWRSKLVTDQQVALLPQSLTTLKLATNNRLSEECIASLPRSLTKLQLGDFAARHRTSSAPKRHKLHWPSNLRSLQLSDGYSVHDCDIAALPRSLSNLSLYNVWRLCKDASLFLSGLPRGLHSLTAIGLKLLPSEFEQCLPALPQTLVHLDLDVSIYGQHYDDVHAPISLCKLAALQNLETLSLKGARLDSAAALSSFQALKHLDVVCDAVSPDDIRSLSAELQHLVLHTPASDLDIAQLRSTVITYLELPNVTTLSSDSLGSVLSRCTALTKLSLPRIEAIDGACLACLPASLAHLDLDSVKTMTDDDAGRLPRSLLTLNMRSNTEWTDKSIALLPRTLTSLCMQLNERITQASAEFFPRSLLSLDLSKCVPWESSALKNLPPRLCRLRLKMTSMDFRAAVKALPFLRCFNDESYMLSMARRANGCVQSSPLPEQYLHMCGTRR